MFDEDYDSELPVSTYERRDGRSPVDSIVDYDEETESVIDGGRNPMSPPQSVVEEEEEVPHSLYDDRRPRHSVNLSVVPEERTMDNEEGVQPEFDSTNFLPGVQALDMLESDEKDSMKKNIFIQDDPRFNNSYNPKEHSWEPSPHNTRREERENEPNRSITRDGQSSQILPSIELETSKNNRSATTKSVKFSDRNETRTLPSLTSSGSSTSTLAQSDERLRPDESPTRNKHDLPSSSRRIALTGIPSSPVESNVSIVSSVLVSTPNDRLTKKQHTRSLRAQFHDISAIGDNKENGNGRGSNSGRSKEIGIGGRGVGGMLASSPASTSDTLPTTELINFIQGTSASTGNDLVRALDQARNSGRILKKPDFGRSARSTTSSSGQSSLPPRPPLSSSHSINTSHSQPVASWTRESSGRSDNCNLSTRLPQEIPSFRKESIERSVDYGREERERERQKEKEISSRRDISGRSEDAGLPPRLPDIMKTSRREVSGRREEMNGHIGLPPRLPRLEQSTVEDERRKNEKNTSTHSTLSTRSSQYSTVDRVDSRAESVASTLSNNSSSGHDRVISISDGNSKEVDFGYVNVGESKLFVLRGRNLLSFPVTCRYSLRGSRHREPVFNIMDGTEEEVKGQACIAVKLKFTPSQVANFYDYLVIDVSGGGVNKTHKILIGGKGGRAHVVLTQRSGLHPYRSSGEFLLQSGSSQTASIGVENAGKRTAYVRAVVLDGYERRVEGVVFTPSDSFVLSPTDKQPIKVDLSRSNLNESVRCSSSSSIGSVGGDRLRRSSTSSINSISSSAASGSRVPPAYKIVLYSGEESQRQRMIGWCRKHGHTSFPPLCPVNEDFSRPFHGEIDTIDKKRPTFSSIDKNLFIASITTTTINVQLSGVRYSAPLDDSADGDRTLVPDDSFGGGNDTMMSMDAEVTAIKIRR